MRLSNKSHFKDRSKKNLFNLKNSSINLLNKKMNNKIDKKNKILTEMSNKIIPIKNPKKNLDQMLDLNDYELNSLEYKKAVTIDKRNYFQYYYSLLKKKHLILFAFYPINDYNLIAIKISLLILSFSLYFTINGFFFTDKTMNIIYVSKGIYNIINQISQILYSTLISSIINMLLKLLSLSEKQILSIKSQKTYLSAKKKSNEIQKCLKIQLTIFFILSFLLMLFFWYFISCFCAVYYNTQIILIKDTLLSFALSMIYPFGLNLLPGILRIPALRTPKKDRICLYKISNLVALI